MTTENQQNLMIKIMFIMYLKQSTDIGSNSYPFILVVKLSLFRQEQHYVLSLDIECLIYLCLNCSSLSRVTVFRQITICNIFV